jgi:hypothetical protein
MIDCSFIVTHSNLYPFQVFVLIERSFSCRAFAFITSSCSTYAPTRRNDRPYQLRVLEDLQAGSIIYKAIAAQKCHPSFLEWQCQQLEMQFSSRLSFGPRSICGLCFCCKRSQILIITTMDTVRSHVCLSQCSAA